MFAEGELSLAEADCCVKGLPKAWLRSSSFTQKSALPALYLLHPTQPHQTTSTTTPPSVAALETISNFQNNDLIAFFGVSGCGKTRAVVEVLARTWGFYLNGNSPPSKFLIVLDEAQTLSDHGKNRFVSHADSGDLRSILSPIIHVLRSISNNPQNYCVATCGTGISADELEVLLSSGRIGSSWDQVNPRNIDFPGWETVEQVAMYINNLGDLMCEDDKAKLHTLMPETAIQ